MQRGVGAWSLSQPHGRKGVGKSSQPHCYSSHPTLALVPPALGRGGVWPVPRGSPGRRERGVCQGPRGLGQRLLGGWGSGRAPSCVTSLGVARGQVPLGRGPRSCPATSPHISPGAGVRRGVAGSLILWALAPVLAGGGRTSSGRTWTPCSCWRSWASSPRWTASGSCWTRRRWGRPTWSGPASTPASPRAPPAPPTG